MKLELTALKLKFLEDNFDAIKNKYNASTEESKDDYRSQSYIDTPFGHMWFNKPKDVLWLYFTSNGEDYEGSQTQIGVKKDGTIMWGYFSHCSCFGYEDYDGEVKEFVGNPDTFKMYEMTGVEQDVLNILNKNFNKIYDENI